MMALGWPWSKPWQKKVWLDLTEGREVRVRKRDKPHRFQGHMPYSNTGLASIPKTVPVTLYQREEVPESHKGNYGKNISFSFKMEAFSFLHGITRELLLNYWWNSKRTKTRGHESKKKKKKGSQEPAKCTSSEISWPLFHKPLGLLPLPITGVGRGAAGEFSFPTQFSPSNWRWIKS